MKLAIVKCVVDGAKRRTVDPIARQQLLFEKLLASRAALLKEPATILRKEPFIDERTILERKYVCAARHPSQGRKRAACAIQEMKKCFGAALAATYDHNTLARKFAALRRVLA